MKRAPFLFLIFSMGSLLGACTGNVKTGSPQTVYQTQKLSDRVILEKCQNLPAFLKQLDWRETQFQRQYQLENESIQTILYSGGLIDGKNLLLVASNATAENIAYYADTQNLYVDTGFGIYRLWIADGVIEVEQAAAGYLSVQVAALRKQLMPQQVSISRAVVPGSSWKIFAQVGEGTQIFATNIDV